MPRQDPGDLADIAGWKGKDPNAPGTFRFAVLADRTGGHIPGQYEAAVEQVNALRPDFVMCVGDLIEGYTDDPAELRGQWIELDAIIARLDAPFFYAPGNHDVRDEPGKAVARPAYLQRHGVGGNSYYAFDYGGCRFVVLDSMTADTDAAFAAEQAAWLKQDMATAADAKHVFVFDHHPLFEGSQIWPAIEASLPKGKTTVFSGHIHTLRYGRTDGIDHYTLAATGTAVDPANPAFPGGFPMFAQVTVSDGEPTVAFVPIRGIRTAADAQHLAAIRTGLEATAGLGLGEQGGEVLLNPSNDGAEPLTAKFNWSAAGWSVSPETAEVTLSPGQTKAVRFALAPASKAPAAPVLRQNYDFGDARPLAFDTPVPVRRSGSLGQLPAVTLDGVLDEWVAIPGVGLTPPQGCFQGVELCTGAADASATLKAAVVGDSLAIAVEVTDEAVVAGGSDWGNGDVVEVCWDVRPAGDRKPGMTAGAGQIGLWPHPADGPARVEFIPAMQYGQPVPEGVKSFCTRTETGYAVELLVPLNELGLAGGTATAGTVALAICLDDLDPAQAGQTRISSTGDGNFWRTTGGYVELK